jgi:hypothetical protein
MTQKTNLFCLIISKSVELNGKFILSIKCVSSLSATSVCNIFPSDKHIKNYARVTVELSEETCLDLCGKYLLFLANFNQHRNFPKSLSGGLLFRILKRSFKPFNR